MTDRLWLVLLDYPMLLPECVVVRFIKIIDHSNLGHCQHFAFKGPWRSNPDSSLPLQFVGKCLMEFRLWLRPIRDYSFYPRTILIHSLEFDRCWPISGLIFLRNNFSNWSITTTLSIHRLRSKIGPLVPREFSSRKRYGVCHNTINNWKIDMLSPHNYHCWNRLGIG